MPSAITDVNRDESPSRESEMDSPSFEGFSRSVKLQT